MRQRRNAPTRKAHKSAESAAPPVEPAPDAPQQPARPSAQASPDPADAKFLTDTASPWSLLVAANALGARLYARSSETSARPLLLQVGFDTKLARKLGQFQLFITVSHECHDQLASFGRS
jgi:hypothetical protein